MRAYLTARKHFRCSFFFPSKLLKELAHFDLQYVYLLKGDSIHISLPAWEIDVVSAIFTETTQSTAHPRFQLCMRECLCVCVCVSVFQLNLRVHLPKTKCEILSQSQGETTWAIPEATLWSRPIVALAEIQECRPGWLCMCILENHKQFCLKTIHKIPKSADHQEWKTHPVFPVLSTDWA